MKICFFLQRRWVIIGHSIACNLKKNFPDTEFCAFVGMRPSLEFLQEQKDLVYTSLLLEEDIHNKLYNEKIDLEYLRTLEKAYGIPNLWPYIYYDRVILSGQLVREYPHNKALLSCEEMMKRIQVTAKSVIEFLDREKPDVLVFSVVGSMGSSMLYNIAKKRGIKTINVELTRINNGITFSENYKTFTWVKKRFEEIQKGQSSPRKEDAKKFLSEFRDRPAPYHQQFSVFKKQANRRANLAFLQPEKLAKSIHWHFNTFFKDLKKKRNNDYTDIFIWWIIWDKLKRKTRGLIGYSDLYSTVNPNDRYAFYPLHYDPETATMLYAPHYTDQIHLIRQIARSLPLDMKLYVKEHPAMMGYRPRSFYKTLLKIPNVKLIPTQENGFDLARNAALTTTITSTGGWESILLKTPVITFGDVYYNDIPGVKRCRSYEDLALLVKEQLEEWEHNEDQLVNYISALLEDSVPVDYMDLWLKAETATEVIENEGITGLSATLAEKLGSAKNPAENNRYAHE
jgi:hypothetical protein